MKISRQSKLIGKYVRSWFQKDADYTIPMNTRSPTNRVFMQLYDDICDGAAYVKSLKHHPSVSVEEIQHVRQIPYPKMFPVNAIPKCVREIIEVDTHQVVSITFNNVLARTITFQFILNDIDQEPVEKYMEYARLMLMWLYIADQYACSPNCGKTLVVYLYFTETTKRIPTGNMNILGEEHVNTAFTSTCPANSEIIIYRKEEWFKVFIHETFHNFALDFSGMDTTECHDTIKKTFSVKSDVNLFESYTEFWAEIMNICFCSYATIKSKRDTQSYLSKCTSMLENERVYSVMQMVKALGYMGLSYNSMYGKSKTDVALRKTLYKENTNVLAYFVVKTILMVNYSDFFKWCIDNNTSLLQFKKTITNQRRFCQFIANTHNTRYTTEFIGRIQAKVGQIYKKRMDTNKLKEKETLGYMLYNLRMSIYELE